MNAIRYDLSPFDAIEDMVTRYGVFAILRALIAHRLGRRRRKNAVRPVDIPPHLHRDLGLHEPWIDRSRNMDVTSYR
jgi:hypothetical protein